MSAAVVQMFTDPSIHCQICDREVHGRWNGANIPCGHVSPAVVRCVAWDPVEGCLCDREAADALQDALEASDAEVMAQRRADAIVRQAEQWRPNLWCWIGFAVMAALVLGALATIGIGR